MASSSGDSPSSKSYSSDPALYMYTSLTAGSSHIVTATSRLETILRANRVPFKALDIATDEKARMLWGRRAGKDESGRVRKLPGLVQMGVVLGDLVEIEDWNEYGELKQHVTMYYDEHTQPPISQKPKTPPPAKPAPAAPPAPSSAAQPPADKSQQGGTSSAAPATAAAVTLPIRSIAEEAAARAKQVRLQSLRDKVYGKGGTKENPNISGSMANAEEGTATKASDDAPRTEGGAEEAAATATAPAALSKEESRGSIASSISVTPPPPRIASGADLQSPTTGSWKGQAPASPDGGGATLRMVQSPTTSSWHPTDVDAPVTTHRGSVLTSASAEEIEAIEQAEMIPEEPEEEAEAEAESLKR